jgi:hypothetical protein
VPTTSPASTRNPISAANRTLMTVTLRDQLRPNSTRKR